MRGQINVQLNDYNQAINDIRCGLEIVPDNSSAHEILADLLLFLNDYKGSLGEYEAAMKYNKKVRDKIVQKKLVVQYKLKQYEDVIKTCDIALSKTNKPSIYYYYKGKALKNLKQNLEAILSLEQVIKFDDIMETKALYNLAKIKTRQKDFYGAYHFLNRLPKDLQIIKINHFHKLIEGVIHINHIDPLSIKEEIKGSYKTIKRSNRIKAY